MAHCILVTGGAGFIGTHIVERLLEKGNEIIIFDDLNRQVHSSHKRPSSIECKDSLHFIQADIRSKTLLKEAVLACDSIIHLAGMVGVGQSMYEVERYVDINSRGTACLLDLLANEEHSVKKLVVASSVTVYGEGTYKCPKCEKEYHPNIRSKKNLEKGIWDHLCPFCGDALIGRPTNENSLLKPLSLYGITKKHQEEMSLLLGRTYGIPTVALRFFNVFGPGQTLSNPYAGVVALFLSRIMNNQQPLVFEDGEQTRDFVYVKDVVEANMIALQTSACDFDVFNVGSGTPTSIFNVANTISRLCNKDVQPLVTYQRRVGDVRHCFADITKMKRAGFRAHYQLEDGLKETLQWGLNETPRDFSSKSIEDLKTHNLIT